MSTTLKAALTGICCLPLVVISGDASGQTQPGDSVQTLLLRNGNDAGRYRRNDEGRDRPLDQVGAGNEQAQLAQLSSGEILIFGTGSYRVNGELPNNTTQGLCMSVTMDPLTGPTLTTMKYVSNNNGNRDRNFMHPRVTPIFNGEAVAVSYNYARDEHARRYTQVFGAGCETLSERAVIMAKNNDNCSENKDTGLVVTQTETLARLFEMDGCNGNGRDDAWVAMARIEKTGNAGDQTYDVSKEFDLSVENNEERSRGTVMDTGVPGFAVACWTAGNTQPPNKGVRCAGIDVSEGVDNNGDRLLWREYIERRENDTYRTEIRTTGLTDAAGNPTPYLVSTYQESNGRRRRGKGNQSMKAITLMATPDGITKMTAPQLDVFPASDPTHGTLCTTLWGVDGAEEARVALLSSSFNGTPGSNSVIQVTKLDPETNQLTGSRRVSLNAAIDNQWISNIYGNNPNNQGRNFIQCVGNIRNPGYGVPGGYMEDVKSFIAVPATTRRMDVELGLPEEKLATELVLVPAVVAPKAAEEDPGEEDPGEEDPGEEPGEEDPANPGEENPDDYSPSAGCMAAGGAGGLGSLLFLGMAIASIRRRYN